MYQARPLPFDKMNETDVRETVVVRLLDALGYATGTEFDVIREQTLRYPHQSLGRKKPGKDPVLRGRADYILQVRERVRWVLEVKAPNEPLDQDAIEQAYTYANHPEVRAVYFMLCNGPELVVHAVSSGPDVPPLLRIAYDDLPSAFPVLFSVLGPAAIERDFPHYQAVAAPPLGPGLRSTARILNGFVEYTRSTFPSTALLQLRAFIVGGSVQRNDQGKLVAFLETQAAVAQLQAVNEKFGLHAFEIASEHTEMSTDPSAPTIWTYQKETVFPAGTLMLNVNTWQEIQLPFELRSRINVRVVGILSGNVFDGSFRNFITMGPHYPEVIMDGRFNIRLG